MSAQATNKQVLVCHAGSLSRLVDQDLGPGFTAVTGYGFENIAGPAVGLANQIRQGEIAPDVFMSADASAVPASLRGLIQGTYAP